jgi:hypothetical protein
MATRTRRTTTITSAEPVVSVSADVPAPESAPIPLDMPYLYDPQPVGSTKPMSKSWYYIAAAVIIAGGAWWILGT